MNIYDVARNNLKGSWVAMPTPFNKKNEVDFPGFETLINRQIKYGTSMLFVLGSAGEVTLLTIEEKKAIVREVISMTKGRIPVFFSAASLNTEGCVEMAKYIEEQGGDGVIFTVPPYLLLSQHAAKTHLDTCMGATSLPCGIYNNPSRLGVNVTPETIKLLSNKYENFVVMKEAMGNVEQLVQERRLCGDKINILCCDYPKYSIVVPTLALGGTGTANIGGNIIPEEAAKYSRPWSDIVIMKECREEYFKWYPLLEKLYDFSNPVVIKAALRILGLPSGNLRSPYEEYSGERLKELEYMMGEMGIIDKYGIKTL